MPRLTLLDEPAWDGHPLPGGRVRDLLATLVLAGRRGAADGELVDRLWEDPPAGGAKALQVVVARTRSATAPGVVVRTATGYRLGDDVEVDAWTLQQNATVAAELLTADPGAVPALLDNSPLVGPAAGDDALAELRRTAAAQRVSLEIAAGSGWSRIGRHQDALDLLDDRSLPDEPALADRLRSTAAIRGTATALETYERIRLDLADRLGIDPSPELKQLHAELLVADDPVRTGVEAARNPLLGRDSDLAEVRTALLGSRLVTVLGSGGLGKTTLAQTVARASTLPVVHVVPLVSVVDDGDVVRAVADALGVRETATERRSRSEAGAALAGRIAAQLTGPPTLLVLDNCEQVVGGVADLVAHLISAVPRLTVLATSRTPLQLAAERIVALAALPLDDAVELFRSRATALRPGVALPTAVVQEIVTRLDGVPLAIELAAAQVRLRSVAEIAAALDARFELLRGGPRDLPDRHRTLLAVIDWSWQLLDPAVRQALGRLSAFRSPFSRAAAAAVLGDRADEALSALVDHSLLLVDETSGSVRFRMLETVREFGAMRLAATGETAAAHDAVREWAVALIREAQPALGTGAEVAAVRQLIPEMPELSEVLRRALADDDLDTVLAMGHPLGLLWLLRGDRTRVGVLVAIGARVVERADEIGPALLDPARNTLAMAILAESFLAGQPATAARETLARWGPGPDPRIAAAVRVSLVPLDDNRSPDLESLLALAHGSDPLTAGSAWQWATFVLENQGDFVEAIEAAEAALALLPPDPAASSVAMLLNVQAQLLTHLGRSEEAKVIAVRALSLFKDLLSDEDAAEMHALLAMIDLGEGRLAAVRRAVDDWPEDRFGSGASGSILPRWVRGELALREGDITSGLDAFVAVLADADSWFPVDDDGLSASPWSTGALMAAVLAHARWSPDEQGKALYDRAVATARLLLVTPRLDYPLLGSLVYSIAAWNLLVLDEMSEPVLTLVALARRFGHGMTLPTWPVPEAERLVASRRPELWPVVAQRMAELPRTELREELGRVLAQLSGSHILRA